MTPELKSSELPESLPQSPVKIRKEENIPRSLPQSPVKNINKKSKHENSN
jgi:hypothetical protein